MRLIFKNGSLVMLIIIGGFVVSRYIANANNLKDPPKYNEQAENFQQDISKAKSYTVHDDLGWDYAKNGQYEKAIEEYKKAIEIIESMPGDEWPNLKKEDADRIKKQSRIDSQIFSRYQLIDVLDKGGRYEEALDNVEWLMRNQQIKGKEEFLKKKLEGMKQNILQKMQVQQTS
jgi:tetratricopeptide (TPR) repeat protein